mgnify:CR=1 FL=1
MAHIELDTSVGYLLKEASTALCVAMEAVLRPLGMTVTHYSCLELLAQLIDFEDVLHGELGHHDAALRQDLARARQALDDALKDPLALQRVLGEYLTEPKGHVSFDGGDADVGLHGGLVLDRRTRMAYDAKHIFINGESFLASGRDAQLMRTLADERTLHAAAAKRLSGPAQDLLLDWMEAGWVHGDQ